MNQWLSESEKLIKSEEKIGTEIEVIKEQITDNQVRTQVYFLVTWKVVFIRYLMILKNYSRSKFEFSFVAPIHFLQKYLGEVDKISNKFILCDHVRNS